MDSNLRTYENEKLGKFTFRNDSICLNLIVALA
jgi:hypothetical protein